MLPSPRVPAVLAAGRASTAMASNEQVAHLLQLLQASLSPDAGARRAAEAALEAGAAAPGFGSALVAVLLAAGGDVDPGLRQLAATVLKKLVREHWTPESPHYRGPGVGEGEKAAMRERLPEGLGDESSKVRTAVAMAVAAIARWDCPQQWPGLIPGLVQAITAKKNAHLGELIRLESVRCCWPGRALMSGACAAALRCMLCPPLPTALHPAPSWALPCCSRQSTAPCAAWPCLWMSRATNRWAAAAAPRSPSAPALRQPGRGVHCR